MCIHLAPSSEAMVSAFCPVSGTAVPIGQYSGACFDRSLLCNSLSHPPTPQAFTATVLSSCLWNPFKLAFYKCMYLYWFIDKYTHLSPAKP